MDSATPPTEKALITLRERLLYGLMWSMLRGLTLLPLRLLYGISDFGAFVLERVVGYRREMITQNMRRAFPGASEGEIAGWRRKFYRHLCDVAIEAAKLARISDAEIGKRVEVEGVPLMNKALESGRPVVLFLGHYGNWEWVTSMARLISGEAVMAEIYHPLSNKVMDRIMLRLRSRFGTENIPMASAVRRLLGIRRDGGNFICGFIADQRPFTPELKYWTDFMGIDTPYVAGGEMIGRKVNAVFLYVDVERKKRGYYRLTIKRVDPSEDDKGENPYTRRYLQMLEATIRRDPPYWLWSHNRWKRCRD